MSTFLTSLVSKLATLISRERPMSGERRAHRKTRLARVAITSSLVLAITGCDLIPVTSNDGVLTATVGTSNTVYWYFFNQDFKDFATVNPDSGRTAREVYDLATASHPGSKYLKIKQRIDGSSELSGSGASRQVLLKANELANPYVNTTRLSATEEITLDGPAYGFTWLTNGSDTRVSTIVPSDLCGLFVMASTDSHGEDDIAFWDDIRATTDTYRCASPVSEVASPLSGPPGIFLFVAGPIGRSASDSPIYYGADRAAVTSTYLLTVTKVSNVTPSATVLAEGTIDSDGSFSSMVRLPSLAPGTYNVRMTGTHSSGSTLQLTSQITIGGSGEFTSIGENIPVIR